MLIVGNFNLPQGLDSEDAKAIELRNLMNVLNLHSFKGAQNSSGKMLDLVFSNCKQIRVTPEVLLVRPGPYHPPLLTRPQFPSLGINSAPNFINLTTFNFGKADFLSIYNELNDAE